MKTLAAILLLFAILVTGCASRPQECGNKRYGECAPSSGEVIGDRAKRQVESSISGEVNRAIRETIRGIMR